MVLDSHFHMALAPPPHLIHVFGSSSSSTSSWFWLFLLLLHFFIVLAPPPLVLHGSDHQFYLYGTPPPPPVSQGFVTSLNFYSILASSNRVMSFDDDDIQQEALYLIFLLQTSISAKIYRYFSFFFLISYNSPGYNNHISLYFGIYADGHTHIDTQTHCYMQCVIHK